MKDFAGERNNMKEKIQILIDSYKNRIKTQEAFIKQYEEDKFRAQDRQDIKVVDLLEGNIYALELRIGAYKIAIEDLTELIR